MTYSCNTCYVTVIQTFVCVLVKIRGAQRTFYVDTCFVSPAISSVNHEIYITEKVFRSKNVGKYEIYFIPNKHYSN